MTRRACGPTHLLPAPLKEVKSTTSATYGNDQADDDAVRAILGLLSGRYASSTKFDKQSAQMLADLAPQKHEGYEPGLSALGTLLGAEASMTSEPLSDAELAHLGKLAEHATPGPGTSGSSL
jgi:hypothetical protein